MFSFLTRTFQQSQKLELPPYLKEIKDNTHFNDQEIIDYKKMYSKLCQNNSNQMTETQFQTLMRMMCVKSNGFLISRIFKLIDADGDGVISFKEFMLYFNTLLKGDNIEKAEFCFLLICEGNPSNQRKEIQNKSFSGQDLFQMLRLVQQSQDEQILDDEEVVMLEEVTNNMMHLLGREKDERVDIWAFRDTIDKNVEFLNLFDVMTEGLKELVSYQGENKYTNMVRVLKVIKDKFDLVDYEAETIHAEYFEDIEEVPETIVGVNNRVKQLRGTGEGASDMKGKTGKQEVPQGSGERRGSQYSASQSLMRLRPTKKKRGNKKWKSTILDHYSSKLKALGSSIKLRKDSENSSGFSYRHQDPEQPSEQPALINSKNTEKKEKKVGLQKEENLIKEESKIGSNPNNFTTSSKTELSPSGDMNEAICVDFEEVRKQRADLRRPSPSQLKENEENVLSKDEEVRERKKIELGPLSDIHEENSEKWSRNSQQQLSLHRLSRFDESGVSGAGNGLHLGKNDLRIGSFDGVGVIGIKEGLGRKEVNSGSSGEIGLNISGRSGSGRDGNMYKQRKSANISYDIQNKLSGISNKSGGKDETVVPSEDYDLLRANAIPGKDLIFKLKDFLEFNNITHLVDKIESGYYAPQGHVKRYLLRRHYLDPSLYSDIELSKKSNFINERAFQDPGSCSRSGGVWSKRSNLAIDGVTTGNSPSKFENLGSETLEKLGLFLEEQCQLWLKIHSYGPQDDIFAELNGQEKKGVDISSLIMEQFVVRSELYQKLKEQLFEEKKKYTRQAKLLKSAESQLAKFKTRFKSLHSYIEEFKASVEALYFEFNRKMNDLTKKHHNKYHHFGDRKSSRESSNDTGLQRKNTQIVSITSNLWETVVFITNGIERAVHATEVLKNLEGLAKGDYVCKNTFQIAHLSLNKYRKCVFVDYAPRVFSVIRNLNNITEDDYLRSLGKDSLGSFLAGQKSFRSSVSSGKSGSFFFTSSDGNYFVKTLPDREFEVAKEILYYYLSFLNSKKQENGQTETLISNFYGLHKLHFVDYTGMTRTVNIIVMENIFKFSLKLHREYDLKGSTYGRVTSPSSLKKGAAGKDLNFINMKERLNISCDDFDRITDMIISDSKFLMNCRIIDYSLIVGIHDKQAALQDQLKKMEEQGIARLMTTSSKQIEKKETMDFVGDIGGHNSPSKSAFKPKKSKFMEEAENEGQTTRRELLADEGNERDEPLKRTKILHLGGQDTNFLGEVRKVELQSKHFKQCLDRMNKKVQLMLETKPNCVESICGRYVYVVGIIDTFTYFNVTKKAEYLMRRYFQSKDASCIPPKRYSSRFREFLVNEVFYPILPNNRKIDPWNPYLALNEGLGKSRDHHEAQLGGSGQFGSQSEQQKDEVVKAVEKGAWKDLVEDQSAEEEKGPEIQRNVILETEIEQKESQEQDLPPGDAQQQDQTAEKKDSKILKGKS